MKGIITSKESTASRISAYAQQFWLLAPLLQYLILAISLGIASRERFNSDGVCYLHRATLLAHGDFFDSISAYWSPGLTWSVVPLLWLGADPLHAIHLALLVWGAGYVIAAQLFLRSIAPSRGLWVLISGVAIALVAARLAMPVITPDLLLGALFLFYLYLVPRRPCLASLIAGLAFLAKAYALPFFIVHFLMTVLVRRLGCRSLAYGYLSFALIAGPWISVLSWKYGRFTFSTAATRNRFMQDVAPPDVREHPPDVSRIPPGPFLTNMEVTDADAWPNWSPLDSRQHFDHQLHIAVEHAFDLLKDMWKFDYIGFALLAFVAVLISRERISWWLLLTSCIYAGGLLFVVYETRYALPILLPVALALCLQMCQRWEPRVLPFIITACFAGSAGWGLYSAMTAPHLNVSDRQIAGTILDDHLNGLFATNTANRDRASCVAFFLNQKFIALPLDVDARILQSKMDADGVKFLYRWLDPNYVGDSEWPEPQMRLLLADGGWSKRRSIHLDSRRRLEIYERIIAQPTAPSSTSIPPSTNPVVHPAL